jgi:hypothetical protein
MTALIETLPPIRMEEMREAGYDILPFHEDLYTNFTHDLDVAVMFRLRQPLIAQHSAWDYCGYVWRDRKRRCWVESVYAFHRPVATYACARLRPLITHVLDTHGDA